MIAVHIGDGFFVPERGYLPTKDIKFAMQFSSQEEAEKFLIEQRYARPADFSPFVNVFTGRAQ